MNLSEPPIWSKKTFIRQCIQDFRDDKHKKMSPDELHKIYDASLKAQEICQNELAKIRKLRKFIRHEFENRQIDFISERRMRGENGKNKIN